MGDQNHQQLFGHPSSFSTTPMSMEDDSVYQINPNLSLHPVNEVTPNSIGQNAPVSQAPLFYDQPRIYPEISVGGSDALSGPSCKKAKRRQKRRRSKRVPILFWPTAAKTSVLAKF